ncbi:hypothetical protein OB2597_06655 [Pseudooceanicola batsensis HTCC2597]|uniref:Uncharacterized protein n=1 Tax=Pseudooceanicola batsensis (strain ATCC BAA-863 / DSM 15984 / KCTC 12145 / HTCC2597) TaxID=252305 RepID=A3TTG6_PSEBH|nr:hypothetical protein [Pseudooceanicola batsensis]EAQ04943.1 hypothetical protein OB2597_06655 [Pseudooceanicola batsensis HTCC2597]
MMKQNRGPSHARHLSTLADLAAKSWRDLFEGKQQMPREMREALLENSLDVQRRYAEKAMRGGKAKSIRTKNMKGFQGLLNDVAFILHAARVKHGRQYSKAMQAEIDLNFSQSRAHHFPFEETDA